MELQQAKSTGLRGSRRASNAAGRLLSSQGTCPLLVKQLQDLADLRSSPTSLVWTL